MAVAARPAPDFLHAFELRQPFAQPKRQLFPPLALATNLEQLLPVAELEWQIAGYLNRERHAGILLGRIRRAAEKELVTLAIKVQQFLRSRRSDVRSFLFFQVFDVGFVVRLLLDQL